MLTLTPSRLKLARKRRGLTKLDLARAVGVSDRSISAYEAGQQRPSLSAAAELAKVLGVSDTFLSGTDIDDIPQDAVSFRKSSKLTASDRNRALASGRIAILLAEWIDSRFQLPESDIPSLPEMEPETAAEIVRTRWQLGAKPIGSLIHLLESKGVRIFSLAEDCFAVDAFSLFWNKTPFIFLNMSKSSERARFDAAHELGHLVLHSEHAMPHGPSAEQQANRFASAFLMPSASIFSSGFKQITDEVVIAMKGTWKVSAMALTLRLHQLNLLSEWRYRTICVELSRRGYRRTEPDGDPHESSQLLRKVLAYLRQSGTRPSNIADDIGISVSELNKHFFGLVPTVIAGNSVSASVHQDPLPGTPILRLIKSGRP